MQVNVGDMNDKGLGAKGQEPRGESGCGVERVNRER